MFQRRETYMKLAHLPLAERAREMQKPEIKSAILKDDDVPVEDVGAMANVHLLMRETAAFQVPIGDPVDYEPDMSQIFGARAGAEKREVSDLMYDYLVSKEGQAYAILMGANYISGNHDVIHTMLSDPHTVTGLSDAGAHVNLIFDAVAPTYQLMHWVRDRSRGPKLPVEHIVFKQTNNNAQLYGMHDRGSLEVGKRADLNLIDFENLGLGALQAHTDLPAGGSRILQSASGYIATFVNGVQTRANDADTGARPGRLVRTGVA